MVRSETKSKYLVALLLVVSMVFGMFASSISAFALGSSGNVSEETAMKNLTVYVYNGMISESYPLENGGSIPAEDLFTGSVTEGYDLNEDKLHYFNDNNNVPEEFEIILKRRIFE